VTRYAILVAAEKYVHFPSTPFAHADAELLYETLTVFCDYPVQHALLLRLSPEDNKAPSELLDAIRKAVNGMEPGDSVLFYFAGHGHYLDGQTYLLLPNTVPDAYETSALSLADISKELRQPSRSCFRIFDACHSGIDVRGDSVLPDSSTFVRAVTHDATGWVTLAACREDQYSVADPQIGHGVFTHYLSEYIRGLKADVKVLPELLKVQIVDSVFEHAKRLGNAQTPTLNASISGNIALAVRRASIQTAEFEPADQISKKDIQSRIAELRKIPNTFDGECLTQLLSIVTESVRKEWTVRNQYYVNEVSGGVPISANEMPASMHMDIVTFVRSEGFQSQHMLERWEEEYEPWELGIPTIIASLYPKSQRKKIKYWVNQDDSLPKSVSILEVAGDGRCIPTLKILNYVIPLQLTVCLLVAAFRLDWPPRKDSLELLSLSYQIQRPEMSAKNAEKLAPFAVGRIFEKYQACIEARVAQLEKETKA
jgi:hypothetical protein